MLLPFTGGLMPSNRGDQEMARLADRHAANEGPAENEKGWAMIPTSDGEPQVIADAEEALKLHGANEPFDREEFAYLLRKVLELVADLRSQQEESKERLAASYKTRDYALSHMEAAEAARDQLRGYARHQPDCPCADKLHRHATGEDPVCTCGLTALLEPEPTP